MTSAIQMPVTISTTVTAKSERVHGHAVAEIVRLVGRALVFFEIGHRRRARRVSRKQRAARTKRQDLAFGFARRWAGHGSIR